MLEIIKQVFIELTQNVEKDRKKQQESIRDKLLALLKEDSTISAKSTAKKLDISERQVQRLLKTMKDDGFIKRSGSYRNVSWIVRELLCRNKCRKLCRRYRR